MQWRPPRWRTRPASRSTRPCSAWSSACASWRPSWPSRRGPWRPLVSARLKVSGSPVASALRSRFLEALVLAHGCVRGGCLRLCHAVSVNRFAPFGHARGVPWVTTCIRRAVDPTVRLRQLFSRVPQPKRDIRPIAMLQAFIDDSKQHQDVLVLAGYHRLLEALGTVFDRVAEALWTRAPSGTSSRWLGLPVILNVRNGSTRSSKIIQQPTSRASWRLVRCGSCVMILALPSFCRNPYNFAIKAILDATYGELGRVGLEWPIEFIFDERGEKVHLRAAWGLLPARKITSSPTPYPRGAEIR